MALTNCKECGHQISKTATQCPNCGAKIKRTSLFTKLVAGFFALVFLGAMLDGGSTSPDKAKEAEKAVAEQVRIAALSPEQQAAEKERLAKEALEKQEQHLKSLGLRWNYNETPDKMGRGTVKLAYVRSLNEVQFDFPYREPQRGTLQFRKHPKYGNDVILNIERGQFLCRFDGCVVSVRFDQGKPLTFSAVEPEDNSTTTLFIRNYDRFVKNARKASKVFVEAQFYQEGNRVFEFETAGLYW